MKTEDRQVCRARRIFWAYNRIWIESRLLLAFLFSGLLVCCALRDTGNGRFRLDVFIPITLFFLLFLLFPLSCWRFALQGWRDVQKRRIAVRDIAVVSCGDDEKHIMQSRGVDVEKYRKVCIVDQDLKKYYCCIARNAPLDCSAVKGCRLRIEYLAHSGLILSLAPLPPLHKREKYSIRPSALSPLLKLCP